MVWIIGSLINKGLTNFTQEVNWGRSWRPTMHPAAQDSGHWWDSQEKKFGGSTAKLPVKHNAKQNTKAVTKGISEFPGKRMQTSKHSGFWRLQVPFEATSGVMVYTSRASFSSQDYDRRSTEEKYISVCFTLQLTVQWRLWHSCDFCFSNKFKFTILETLSRWRKSVLYWTTSPV